MATVPPDQARRGFLALYRSAERRRIAQEMAGRATECFREFVPIAWPTVEPARKFIHNWHTDAMCDHAQAVADGQIKKLLVTVPPGSAKSLLWAVLFPAWMWCPQRNPAWRSTFASYDAVLSTRDSVRCRDLLRSVWYQETFKPEWRFATDQNVKTYFVNSASGHRFSTSVGATSTGFRGDSIVIDDAMKAGDRNSDAAIAGVIDWWTNEMFNRLNDMAAGSKIIIMQRLSDRDLAGHVLREGGFEHCMIPMEYDPARSKVTSIGWKDPRQTHGELMFPQLFPREVVDGELKKDLATYAAQYQQSPNVEGGGILKSHSWNYWQPVGMDLPAVRVKLPNGSIEERKAVTLPTAFDMEFQSWDFAVKDLETSDYVAAFAVSCRGANRYIVDQVHAHLDITGSLQAVREFTSHNPRAHLKLVEDKANGTPVIQLLKAEISGMVAVTPKGSKIERAMAGSSSVESGNWYLPHPKLAPWVGNPENPSEGGFLAETVLFPFGANDDWVDSWSQAEIHIQKEKVGGELGVSDSDIRVDPFELEPKWPRLYGFSVNWREVGAVWLARRPETDMHYLYAEYFGLAGDPAQHAAYIRKAGDWIQGAIHPVEPGRDEKDGYALMNKYAQLGLKLTSAPDNLAAEITDLQVAMRAGRLKVFGNMPRFFDQLLMWRRDHKTNKLPTQNVALISALLVAWRARDQMRGPFVPEKPKTRLFREGTPTSGWMRS